MRKEEPIGKVIATEKEPTTIDSFCFSQVQICV